MVSAVTGPNFMENHRLLGYVLLMACAACATDFPKPTETLINLSSKE